MHTCPVCGFKGLTKPAQDFVICPSCGVEFGYTDAGPRSKAVIHGELRRNWIHLGALWHSRVVPPPAQWNAWAQLTAAGHGSDLPAYADSPRCQRAG